MVSIGEIFLLALAMAIAGAYILFVVVNMDLPAVRPYLCVEVAGALLRLEGFGAYRVYVNGDVLPIPPGARQWTVEVPLRGNAVEVRIVGGGNATFYAIRLPNGTYVLKGGAKRLCSR